VRKFLSIFRFIYLFIYLFRVDIMTLSIPWLVSNEMENVWKKEAVIVFIAISYHISRGTEESKAYYQSA
jgi:hypothetical protein